MDGVKGRMVKIADLIQELQDIQARFGNTCVYVRDMSWGAVALNRQADDDRAQARLAASAPSAPSSDLCPCGLPNGHLCVCAPSAEGSSRSREREFY